MYDCVYTISTHYSALHILRILSIGLGETNVLLLVLGVCETIQL